MEPASGLAAHHAPLHVFLFWEVNPKLPHVIPWIRVQCGTVLAHGLMGRSAGTGAFCCKSHHAPRLPRVDNTAFWLTQWDIHFDDSQARGVDIFNHFSVLTHAFFSHTGHPLFPDYCPV